MAFSKAAKEAQQMQDNMQLVAELEIEMMSDMYNRMTAGCQRKCIPPKYKDSELSKAEAVCIDRCVAKYMEVHERVGRKLTEMSMQDTALLKSAHEAAKN